MGLNNAVNMESERQDKRKDDRDEEEIDVG